MNGNNGNNHGRGDTSLVHLVHQSRFLDHAANHCRFTVLIRSITSVIVGSKWNTNFQQKKIKGEPILPTYKQQLIFLLNPCHILY